MGFNTTLLILNDDFGDINSDPSAWWDSVKSCLLDGNFTRQHNGFQVASQEHADTTVILAVGGNCVSVLAMISNRGRHTKPEDQLKLIEELADQRGYRLVQKKPGA